MLQQNTTGRCTRQQRACCQQSTERSVRCICNHSRNCRTTQTLGQIFHITVGLICLYIYIFLHKAPGVIHRISFNGSKKMSPTSGSITHISFNLTLPDPMSDKASVQSCRHASPAEQRVATTVLNNGEESRTYRHTSRIRHSNTSNSVQFSNKQRLCRFIKKSCQVAPQSCQQLCALLCLTGASAAKYLRMPSAQMSMSQQRHVAGHVSLCESWLA